MSSSVQFIHRKGDGALQSGPKHLAGFNPTPAYPDFPVTVMDTKTASAIAPATTRHTIAKPSSLHLFLSNATVTPTKRTTNVQTNSNTNAVWVPTPCVVQPPKEYFWAAL
ncbi:PREDICTED: uncharacterized protein LOC101300579 [Fragaria vesca subsp. vesca]